MRIDHSQGRDAFRDELELLLDLAEGLDDDDLLAASRCRGWTAGDVLTHVHLGLQEMLLGVVSPTDQPVTVDSATYWTAEPSTDEDGASETEQVRFVRLLGSAYRRPTGMVRHLSLTGRTLSQAVAVLPDSSLTFQGHVMSSGDFFTTWAVELAVHHLDLGLELTLEPPRPAGLRLGRQTVEELAGGRLPETLSDAEVILIGTGRLTAPNDLDLTGLRIPALG